MIDAVIRRMVYIHYKGISRAYELCGSSLEFTCDVCTAGSPKVTKSEEAFLVLQERCVLLEVHWSPQVARGFRYGDLMQRSCASALAMRALCTYD